MDKVDVCIIGAGVIGLAIAQRLTSHSAFRHCSVVLLEQEENFGQHTSSRNSEVIHAGIYYPPNSLKASLCHPGKILLYEHCRRHNIPHRAIGKFIVATRAEIEQLEGLHARAATNGVSDLQWFDKEQLRKAEPEVEAEIALFSPSTGIIDSHAYMLSLLHLAQNNGCHFAPQTQVIGVEPDATGFIVTTVIGNKKNLSQQQTYRFHSRKLVNCAGLAAQQVAASIAGVPTAAIPKLYPCKGDYFNYNGPSPFQHLIYPLPDPQTRGLGIHSTLDLSGQLRFGPDANYVNDISYDLDKSKATQFAEAISCYFPTVNPAFLQPAYSGIRPKLAGPGDQPADFVIQEGQSFGLAGLLQLFGMESPGLTCSLALAEHVLTLPDLLTN